MRAVVEGVIIMTSYSQSEELYGSHHNMDYYQQPPRYQNSRHTSHQKEPKVNIPWFYGKQNVKYYLDLEMKVEQIFECYQVD